jgi:hypothetical protein
LTLGAIVVCAIAADARPSPTIDAPASNIVRLNRLLRETFDTALPPVWSAGHAVTRNRTTVMRGDFQFRWPIGARNSREPQVWQ